jgi:predicted extracellular nuclease
VFDSLNGSLDHVLANPAARAFVTGADVWQISSHQDRPVGVHCGH